MFEMKEVRADTKEFKDFLALPQKLYSTKHLMQSLDEEVALIKGVHPLSSSIRVIAVVGYYNKEAVIRGLLTFYPESQSCYLGYFESINHQELAYQFFNHLQAMAREFGARSIVGPVQASFWLGYRMQVTGMLDQPFTGEPHNLDYYPQLWQAVGFKVIEEYRSNFYPKVSQQTQERKLAQRFDFFQRKGVLFRTPKKKEWQQQSLEVFALLCRLYQDFPIFHPIVAEQFQVLFEKYRYILNFSMTQLAYKGEDLIGFMIAMPDYGSLVYQKMTVQNIVKLFWLKYFSKQYIILYLGVHEDYLGLGSAMVYQLFERAKRRGASVVGALIHQGTSTDRYATQLKGKQHDYVLYELQLHHQNNS